jgi:hypothetical protein
MTKHKKRNDFSPLNVKATGSFSLVLLMVGPILHQITSMKTPRILLFSVSAVTLLLSACTKSSKSVPIQLLLTDNPATYQEVNIHIKGMQVKMNDDSSGWIELQAKDTTVNLLELQNGVTTLIAQDNVPAGILKEVRFILGNDNSIVDNGTEYPLVTPSAETSGLKIKINKELNETLNTLVLDFDAAMSIKEENNQYKLNPVIRLK